MHYKQIARMVHAVVREYNVVNSIPGDNFVWDKVRPEYRASIEQAVKNQLEDPASNPKESHDRWLADREKEGWVYGKIKDQSKKTHPCMVPYSELPGVQSERVPRPMARGSREGGLGLRQDQGSIEELSLIHI